MTGILIAFEGIDGVGKHTQMKLLAAAATAHGLTVAEFSFPRYGRNGFSMAVARYLNGEFGGADAVPPEFAGLLYAGDRFAARSELEVALTQRDLVLCDRYVASNLAHQGAKLTGARQREFIEWLADIEFSIYQLPLPHLTILLEMPVELAAHQVARKLKRAYTDRTADIHEEDLHYLSRCQQAYEALTEAQIGKIAVIECADLQGGIRRAEAIGNDVWRNVRLALSLHGRELHTERTVNV